jgi:hypothetical protein
LRAALVVLKRDDSVSFVRQFVSNDCVVLVTDDWHGTLLPVRVGEAPLIGLTNSRINGTTLHLATRLGVKTVVSVGTPRPARQWSESRVAISHAKVGGVTNSTLWLGCMRMTPELGAKPPEPLALTVERDASTVLTSAEFSRSSLPRPTPSRVFPLAVQSLSSVSPPVYHGGGLLPWPLDRSVRVACPCLGLAPGRWGIRPLTTSEILLALDWPKEASSSMHGVTNKFLLQLQPGKSLVRRVLSLLGADLNKEKVRGGFAKSKSLRDEKGNIGVAVFFTYFEDPHLEDQTKRSRELTIEGAHKKQRSEIIVLVCPELAQRNLLPKDPKELVSKDLKEAKREGALKRQRSEILEVVSRVGAKKLDSEGSEGMDSEGSEGIDFEGSKGSKTRRST